MGLFVLIKTMTMFLLAVHAVHADRLIVAASHLARLPELTARDIAGCFACHCCKCMLQVLHIAVKVFNEVRNFTRAPARLLAGLDQPPTKRFRTKIPIAAAVLRASPNPLVASRGADRVADLIVGAGVANVVPILPDRPIHSFHVRPRGVILADFLRYEIILADPPGYVGGRDIYLPIIAACE